MLPWKCQCQKYYINRTKAMAKSHTYHMFPFEDRPAPLLSGSDTCRTSPKYTWVDHLVLYEMEVFQVFCNTEDFEEINPFIMVYKGFCLVYEFKIGLVLVTSQVRLDFRRSLESRPLFLPEKPRVQLSLRGRSAGYFPEQRLLIEPSYKCN